MNFNTKDDQRIFIKMLTCLQLLEESDRKLFQKNKHRQLSPSTLHAITSKRIIDKAKM